MAVHDVAAALLILLYAALFRWAFRVLPRDGWQVLATVPQARRPDGRWRGLNLTYYGAFTASAVVVAVALAIVLLGSVAVPFDAILWLSIERISSSMCFRWASPVNWPLSLRHARRTIACKAHS
ncbi:MAG: hypothetical protein E8D43_05475 [Nitrospira sp.]|nr:MAG: hypothetical protein E8D43_05475 [Nitrospira sp.]